MSTTHGTDPAANPPGMKFHPDLCYRDTPQRPLLLDLRVPEGCDEPPPLILRIPMGGFRGCRKENAPEWIVQHGFALATIQARVTSETIAPTQIHDCKAAVRWLRAHAREYGYRGDAIGAWGHSAGGNLAALLATSGDHPALEEPGCAHADVSARVQAACDACGAPHDMTYFARPDVRERHPQVAENLDLYLGGHVAERTELASLVSPATYVSKDCPPVLIIQGEEDKIVPPEESVAFHSLLLMAGVDTTLRLLPRTGHGWDAAVTADQTVAFFKRTLRAVAPTT